MRNEATEALIGRTIADKFQVLSVIGTGAMGAVYKAKQVALEKIVALKVMHGDLAEDPAFAERFHREAKAASRLDHPNSVRVLDFGEDTDGTLYIAMEFLDGKDLLAIMRESWPLPGDRVIDVLMQTLSALGVAHELGIVHRDLKPENIMVLSSLDDEARPVDVVKVCDFGIAKLINDRSGGTNPSLTAKGPLTGVGSLVGTPEYMSPEQGRGDSLDARSDLYSIGVILFHMLTGRVPFMAENAIGIILKHITDDPPRPTSITPHVDPRLEAICLKAMRKRREERYASAREMRADLRAVKEQVRGPLPSQDALASDRSMLQVASAATITDVRGAIESVPSLEQRRTATGTELSSVSAVPKRRRALVPLAALSIAVGVAGAVLVIVGMRSSGARVAASPPVVAVSASASAATPPALIDLSPFAPAAPTASAAPATPDVAPVSSHAAPPAHPHGGHPSAPVVPPPSIPSPTPVAAALVPPAPPPAAATAAPAAPASDDSAYDPSRATVDVGSVNPSNTNGDAVRAAVRSAPLTKCYRDALRARGRRVFGSATLNLSIDEGGRVSGAILTSADWLPEMTRCVQGSTMGLQLRPGSVESGGGTAEVWLSFRAP